MEGEQGKGKKCHTMYRSSWRNCTDDGNMGGTSLEEKKNVQGLCFYIYHRTRQAELQEGYLRQRHLRNKLGSPSSCMGLLKTWLWQPGSCKLDTEQQPLLSGGQGLFPAAASVVLQG